MKMFLLILTFSWITPAQADEVPENIVIIKENSIHVTEHEGQPLLEMEILVKKGFFAYQEKFEINLSHIKALELSIDPVVSFYDKTFKKTKQGVRDFAKITALLKPEKGLNLDRLNVELVYQACTEDYCLFPTQTTLAITPDSEERSILRRSLQPEWLQNGLFFTFAFVFFAGFLTSLTPCVYPMLPITLAVLGASQPKSRAEGFLKSLIYILGLATTYATLGFIAASTGFMFGSIISNTWFLLVLSIILFLGALSMFDVFEIQAPSALKRRISNRQNSASFIALFVTGLFSGLVVGPCVGPVLVGILGYVSQAGSPIFGFLLLFTFALGLGSLILVFGTFSNLMAKIPKSGLWMVKVKKGLGVLFLGLILYFISPILDTKGITTASFFLFFLFGLSVLLADKFSKSFSVGLLEKSILRAVVIFSLIVIALTVSLPKERLERLVGYSQETFANTNWDVFSKEKLVLAKENKQFVVLDFYADWCAACRELKNQTFSKQEISMFSRDIKWLYLDSTRPSDELTRMKEKYNILGLPTILFFDSTGELRSDLTLTGFEKPELFKIRLEKLVSGEKYETSHL